METTKDKATRRRAKGERELAALLREVADLTEKHFPEVVKVSLMGVAVGRVVFDLSVDTAPAGTKVRAG